MSTLPSGPIDVRYNGVVFPPTMTETTEASVRPQYDQAGRTVIFNVYSFTLKSTLGDVNQALGRSTDLDLEVLRKRLTAPGGELRYNGVGLGFDLRVNPPEGGGKRDVVWGPKPRLLKWSPRGQLACDLEWSVEVAVPDCDQATYEFALMELNFRFVWDVDQSGYTRRTYSGFLRIPQTRRTVDDRSLSDQADAYRERIYPPTLVGFRRTPGTYTLSEDKCRLDFEVTDQEVGPYYPPEGVVEVSMSHDVRSGGEKGVWGGEWYGTLTATYEVARDQDRAKAFYHFLNALGGRADRAREVPFGPERKRQQAFLLSFRASHPEIYGKKGASFSATYRFLAELKDLAAASGLWASPPDSDPEAWAESLATTAFHRRGNAKLSFAATGEGIPDVIIDLCLPGEREMSRHAESPKAPDYVLEAEPRNPLPEPETSWLHFQSSIRFEQADDLPAVKMLPTRRLDPLRTLSTTPPDAETYDERTLSTDHTKEHETRPDEELTLDLSRVGSLSVYPPEGDQAKPRYLSQYRNTPEFYVVLTGKALRAGHEVTPPAVRTVGGCDVVPANREGEHGFTRGVAGAFFGVSVYACAWTLRYRVLGVPKDGLAQMDTPYAGEARADPPVVPTQPPEPPIPVI